TTGCNAPSPLPGAARIPCHEGRRSTAYASPCRPMSPRTGALASLVPLAVIGCDLRLQRTTEPVNPRLDLLGRVAILMREHRPQAGQQVEHDPHGAGGGDPLSGEAVVEERGERLEARLALVEVGRGLVGQALRRERREGWGGPPRPRQAFEVRQQVRHPRLQRAWWRIHLRTNQGDEGSTGDEGVGQTEHGGRIMVLEHVLQHVIRRGFRVIQDCHSTFLGAGRASRMLEEGVPRTPHTTPGRCAMCCSVLRRSTHASQSRRVRTGAWSSWGETSVVRYRTCTADVRVAHYNKRCHIEVGAPAKQDCRAAQRRNMSRRPRTETSPWYVDPWSPLYPSIPENHSVDERSMRGVYPGSRAGTKLGGVSPPMCAMLIPRHATLACATWQRGFVALQQGCLRRHAFSRGGCVWTTSNFTASRHRTSPRWSWRLGVGSMLGRRRRARCAPWSCAHNGA